MNFRRTPNLRAVVSVTSVPAALFKVGGLAVLARNLKILKKNGFAVTVKLRAEQADIAIADLCDELGVSCLYSGSRENGLQIEGPHLNIDGDYQFPLSFFALLKNCCLQESANNHRFLIPDGKALPAFWMTESPGAEMSTHSVAGRFFDVHQMLEKHAPKAAARALEDAFFQEIYQNTEGWIARFLNKKLSFPITRYLVKTSITPNQITVICFLIGLLGCGLLLSMSWPLRILGVMLLQLNSVIDGCDGEVARFKVLSSQMGAWLDTIADDVLNNVMFVCLYVGLFRQYHDVLLLKFCLLTTFASVGVSFFLYHFMVTNGDPNAAHYQLAWAKPALKATADQNPKKKSLFDLVKPILKRDFVIFLVMVFVILDWRRALTALFAPVWGAFFLYFASFVYGLRKASRRQTGDWDSQTQSPQMGSL